jgi:hypothetical protein
MIDCSLQSCLLLNIVRTSFIEMSSNIYNEEVVPGTVRLIDANGELNVKHSEGHGDIVLVPTPSGQQINL